VLVRRRGRLGPMLLKKSVFPNEQNFRRALVRSSENYVGAHQKQTFTPILEFVLRIDAAFGSKLTCR
jgi:hypothetical protein